jgi:hypothetical protein
VDLSRIIWGVLLRGACAVWVVGYSHCLGYRLRLNAPLLHSVSCGVSYGSPLLVYEAVLHDRSTNGYRVPLRSSCYPALGRFCKPLPRPNQSWYTYWHVLVRFQHRVTHWIAYCRSFAQDEERADELSWGAALGWHLSAGRSLLVGGAVDCHVEGVGEGVEDMSANAYREVREHLYAKQSHLFSGSSTLAW